MPKFYTVQDLAKMFSRDEETIRRWINDGDTFPGAFKIKDGWYVPKADVTRYIKRSVSRVDKAGPSGRTSKGFVREW